MTSSTIDTKISNLAPGPHRELAGRPPRVPWVTTLIVWPAALGRKAKDIGTLLFFAPMQHPQGQQ